MSQLSHRAVIGIVAQHYGTTPKRLIWDYPDVTSTSARQIAMWVLVQHFGVSLPDGGALFGGRHHTTILHGFRAVAKRLAAEPDYAAKVERLLARINAAEAALADEFETAFNARVAAAVSGMAAPGFVEAHIRLDGTLGPAVKAFVEAEDDLAGALHTVREPSAARRVRECLRDLRVAWRNSAPVPA